ncbi:MAG TPA: hypothetical protein VF613_04325 [Longimicrobium sp.]
MNPFIGPMIVMVTAIITTGSVLILRPIATRLGRLLEVMAEQRLNSAPPPPPVDMSQIRDLLTGIDHRLSLMEERQDFAEALISSSETRAMVHAPQERH